MMSRHLWPWSGLHWQLFSAEGLHQWWWFRLRWYRGILRTWDWPGRPGQWFGLLLSWQNRLPLQKHLPRRGHWSGLKFAVLKIAYLLIAINRWPLWVYWSACFSFRLSKPGLVKTNVKFFYRTREVLMDERCVYLWDVSNPAILK